MLNILLLLHRSVCLYCKGKKHIAGEKRVCCDFDWILMIVAKSLVTGSVCMSKPPCIKLFTIKAQQNHFQWRKSLRILHIGFWNDTFYKHKIWDVMNNYTQKSNYWFGSTYIKYLIIAYLSLTYGGQDANTK